MTMVVFTVVFGKIAKMPSGGVPYPILVYSRPCFPGSFFPALFPRASNSLIGNANLLTKIYFPRIIMPTSTVIVALVDFFIAFAILGLLWFFTGTLPAGIF